MRVLLADTSGGAGIASSKIKTELFWGRRDYVLHATPRLPFRVQLTGPHGESVKEFRVQMRSLSPDAVLRRSVAQDGEAVFFAAPSGSVSVVVVPKAGYSPVQCQTVVEPDGSGLLQLRTKNAVALTGQVRTAVAMPDDAQIRVMIEPVGPSSNVIQARATNATTPPVDLVAVDGRFSVGCDASSSYWVRVQAPGHCPYETRVEPIDGSFPFSEIQLRAAHAVRVRLVPAEATQWLQAYVEQLGPGAVGRAFYFAMVQPTAPSWQDRGEVTPEIVDSDTLTFHGLASGEWQLWLRQPGVTQPKRSFSLSAEQLVVLPDIDLEYLRPGHIRGQLTYDHQLLKPVTVSALTENGAASAVVDRAGRFSIAVPAGEYPLRFTVEAGESELSVTRTERVRVIAGSIESLTVPLALRSLTVKLVDSLTMESVPNVLICISEEHVSGMAKVWKTDANGHAILYPCPIGEFGVSVIDQSTLDRREFTRLVGGAEDVVTVKLVQ